MKQRSSLLIRPSHLVLVLFTLGTVSLVSMLLHAEFSARSEHLAEHAVLVKKLGLTDLALFTESRYTRHPSQADLFTPFQDHPLSFDHFPSGSLVNIKRLSGNKNIFGGRSHR